MQKNATSIKTLRNTIGSNNVKLLAIAACMFLIASVLKPDFFLSGTNFRTMGVQIAETGLFSLAMMVVFISGGIDLSIIAIANLTSVVAGVMMLTAKANNCSSGVAVLLIAVSFVIAFILGGFLGAFNGFLISKLSIPPMLATLGTMNLYMGTAVVITEGKSFSGFPTEVTDFGNGTFLGVPVPFIILALSFVAIIIIVNHTKYGYDLKFFGTNALASKFSGIPNNKVIIKTYMYSGIISAIAGIEMMARTNTARADFGNSYLFISILCAILGGTDPDGGSGSVFGLGCALVILQILSSSFNMLQVNSILKDFIWGALLLAVMVFNRITQQRKKST